MTLIEELKNNGKWIFLSRETAPNPEEEVWVRDCYGDIFKGHIYENLEYDSEFDVETDNFIV